MSETNGHHSGDSSEEIWSEARGGHRAPSASIADQHGTSAPQLIEDDHWLGRIALVYLPHPTIANLYQCCFDYVEPWQWSRETEQVPTGRWIIRNQAGIK